MQTAGRAALNRYVPYESKCRFSNVELGGCRPRKKQGDNRKLHLDDSMPRAQFRQLGDVGGDEP